MYGSMYVILRGRVTVYIQYNKSDSDDRQLLLPPPGMNKSETLRHSLGTFVTHLGPGEQFGEIALIREEIRSASILTEDPSDLVVIHRDLYSRSVKFLLEHDFAEKTYFINEHPQFQKLAPRYRKQLAMAIVKRKLPYDTLLQRQGDTADAIFYVLRGELKMEMDPRKHQTQFPKLIQDVASFDHSTGINRHFEGTIGRRIQSNKASSSDATCQLSKQYSRPMETGLLGRNENVGEVEVLLHLQTYTQTTKSTRNTEVLVLELKHFDRILSRRNVRVVEAMMCCLNLRLTARASSKAVERQLPLILQLKTMADDRVAELKRREAARLVDGRRRRRRDSPSTNNEKPPSDPVASSPAGGQRLLGRILTGAKSTKNEETIANDQQVVESVGKEADIIPPTAIAGAAEDTVAENKRCAESVAGSLMAEESLAELEERISSFVASISLESESNKRSHSAGKAEKLRRAVTPVDGIIRPGVIVIVRPKSTNTYSNDNSRDSRRLRAAKQKWRLHYYKLALTSPVPNFDEIPSDAKP